MFSATIQTGSRALICGYYFAPLASEAFEVLVVEVLVEVLVVEVLVEVLVARHHPMMCIELQIDYSLV